MGSSDLRQALLSRPCFGTFLKVPRPEVVDLLAIAGFDFVIIDMEHGQITEFEARTAIQAATAADISAVVRLPDPTPGLVNRLLEAGAVGIQMPKVRTRIDAQKLRAMMHFPPEGVRSIGIANAWAQYGSVAVDTVVREANQRSVVVGMLETKELEEPIEGILDPLDVAFIGPLDLAVEFGLPNNHPDVQARVKNVEDAARRTKTLLGFPAKSAQQALDLADRGYRYIPLSNDIAMLSIAAQELVAALKKGSKPPVA